MNMVTIPESVVSIGDTAFHRCSALRSVTILSENVSLGAFVFFETANDLIFTLYGYEGSTTQAYAEANRHNFIAIEKPDVPELPGDITGDGTLNIDDALALFQFSILPDVYPVDYRWEMDFTGDGEVDIDDALRLFQHSMLPDVYPLF